MLLKFIQSRSALDKSGPPYREFQIFPFRFNAIEWCTFNTQDHEEIAAFEKLCSMVFAGGFIATSLVPKYLAQLDVDGTVVSRFIQKQSAIEFEQLRLLAFLAAGFQTGTSAWRNSATPICKQAPALTRTERERLFRNLTNHESKAFYSSLGQVASHYVDECSRYKSLLDAEPVNSPLRPYFEWAHGVAKEVLDRETQSAEEDLYGQS